MRTLCTKVKNIANAANNRNKIYPYMNSLINKKKNCKFLNAKMKALES